MDREKEEGDAVIIQMRDSDICTETVAAGEGGAEMGTVHTEEELSGWGQWELSPE